jgi:small subunit ribosomal protein S17
MRGVVVRDKGAKTITVETTRRFQHPVYGKMVRKSQRIAAHDELNQAHVGDTVEIIECRPMSRTKRWRLLRVLVVNPDAAVAAPAAAETPATETPATPTPGAES